MKSVQQQQHQITTTSSNGGHSNRATLLFHSIKVYFATGRFRMTETSSGKLASFSTSRLLCVEYPGYIRSVENMLKTLGSEEQISDTYFNSKRRIELHFRPDDPYCHSVCGDLHTARAVLLKVKKKRKKRKSPAQPQNEWQYEQEVLGIVHSAYRYI